MRAAVSPATGGCFAFVGRLRRCYCSYGLPVVGRARAGAGWAPRSRPPRLLQHRLGRSSSVLPSCLLQQASQSCRPSPSAFLSNLPSPSSLSNLCFLQRRESPHGTQPERLALELAASGNLFVGLVLLRLERRLLPVVHLLEVPVRQGLMLILDSLCQLSPSPGRAG
ncbi:hypothetical protein ACQJBY_071519 [Aegilops geniculata]